MEGDLYSSGIFASELEEDFVSDDKELDPDALLEEDEDLDSEEEDDDDLDDDDDEASYNPLDDYKSDDWS
jgi:hypothetical protein